MSMQHLCAGPAQDTLPPGTGPRTPESGPVPLKHPPDNTWEWHGDRA